MMGRPPLFKNTTIWLGNKSYECSICKYIEEYIGIKKSGEFVVMPNHIHGILILINNDDSNLETTNGISTGHGRDVACNVSTTTTSTSHPHKNEKIGNISPNSILFPSSVPINPALPNILSQVYQNFCFTKWQY